MKGPYLGGHETDVTRQQTRRWPRCPAGEDCDQRRGHGKQGGKGLLVFPEFVFVLYSVKQEARLPNLQALGRAQGADGKVSPGQSLQRSPERRSQTRRQHLTHKFNTL